MIRTRLRQFHRIESSVLRPLVVLTGAVMAVLLLTITALVHHFDDIARNSQMLTARQGYANRIEESVLLVQPRVVSDEAEAHLTRRFDADWAETRLARYFFAHGGVRQLYVLDGKGAPLFASRDGKVAPAGTYGGPIARAVGDILPTLRKREAASHGTVSPLHASTIYYADGELQIVAASLVRPESASAGIPAPVVISVMPFGSAMLARFGARHMVSDLAISQDFRQRSDHAVMPLYDARGRRVAALAWEPSKPGRDMLGRMSWPGILMLVVLISLGFVMARQSSRVARGLVLSEARARHLAFHDTLTELPNRALMLERLRQLRAQVQRGGPGVAVLCIDLDRFKEVNDTMGHPVGDALIRAAARRLAGLLRATDTVARLGGDEFVVLQVQTQASGAAHLAERIVHAFSRPFEIEGHMVEISCSIGITLISDPAASASELMRQADLALYNSKARGRGCATFFEPEMDATLRQRRQLETDLREALAEEMLHMVYQPQTDADGRIVGAEALVRWQHPEKGLIPPFTFVVLAEEAGLMIQLGEFIVRRVFEETRDLRGIPVAINVSALQLRSPMFMSVITRLAAEYGINPEDYEFEITETVLLGDDAATRDNIAALKQEGYAVALDDFGTGYSSLSSLQRFAVDRIKIDRSFVRGLEGEGGADRDSVQLVNAIVRLARALNLEVIAEGVETICQRDRLMAAGCNHFQGYLYSRPMTVGALRDLLASGRRLGPEITPFLGIDI